jgi:hypothetical protein
MGLFGNEVRREFIARPDAAKGQILYKWPDTNIRKLTQLTVEQDEQAVFFRDRQVQGTVNPGRSTLDSSEIPFLGKLVDAASGGNLFKTELYFVSTREFPDLPFVGSTDNVVDPDTGLAVGLRVFGESDRVPWALLKIELRRDRNHCRDLREGRYRQNHHSYQSRLRPGGALQEGPRGRHGPAGEPDIRHRLRSVSS